LFDSEIQKRKTIVMQRLQKSVSHGYEFYIQGEIHYKKSLQFVHKMNEKYGTHFNENKRSYQRKLGKANAFLYLYPKKNTDQLIWWLVATKGEGRIHQEEKLISVFDPHQRLTSNPFVKNIPMTKPAKLSGH